MTASRPHLRPTRRYPSHRMLLNVLILLLSPLSTHAIPFSTVFRRTTSLLKRPLFGMNQYDERIPSFLRKSRPTSITETVYSLLGGFATDSVRRHRKFSLSSALYEETISKTKAIRMSTALIHTESAHLTARICCRHASILLARKTTRRMTSTMT